MSPLSIIALMAISLPPFKAGFDDLYVKNTRDREFAAAARQANCLICHGYNAQGREDKRIKNAYGEALGKLIDRRDAKDPKKIRAALQVIAEEPSNPLNHNPPTFGERISRGQLPAGR